MGNTLTKSEYFFEKEYKDSQNRILKARVKLEVSFIDKTYIITPLGTANKEFGFLSNSKNNNSMWIAVCELLLEAIAFANDLVEEKLSTDEILNSTLNEQS